MDIVEWAVGPWGENVPIHIAWFLIWVAAIAGLLLLIVHAICVRYFAGEKEFAESASHEFAARVPESIPRQSWSARLFHWIIAAAMFILLLTAFLPTGGIQFDWVTYHWIAGTVLTVYIIFHAPRKFAKYSPDNKLSQLAIITTGFSAILTGVFMMLRGRTSFLPRDPYLFTDMTWGLMYVLHGLAGIGLIALVTAHVYFAVRSEKLPMNRHCRRE